MSSLLIKMDVGLYTPLRSKRWNWLRQIFTSIRKTHANTETCNTASRLRNKIINQLVFIDIIICIFKHGTIDKPVSERVVVEAIWRTSTPSSWVVSSISRIHTQVTFQFDAGHVIFGRARELRSLSHESANRQRIFSLAHVKVDTIKEALDRPRSRWRETLSSSAGSGVKPQPPTILVHFRHAGTMLVVLANFHS